MSAVQQLVHIFNIIQFKSMTRYTGKSGTTLVCCRRPCSDPVLVAKLGLTDASQDGLCGEGGWVQRSTFLGWYSVLKCLPLRPRQCFLRIQSLLPKNNLSPQEVRKWQLKVKRRKTHPMWALRIQGLGNSASFKSRAIQGCLPMLQICAPALVWVAGVTPVFPHINKTLWHWSVSSSAFEVLGWLAPL